MIHWIFWENSHFKKTCLENPFLGFEGADSGSSCSRTWKESESNTDLGGWCSFKCITCGIDVVLWRRQIVTILNSCFCQTRRRTIWLFPSDISCELPKTGKLSRTDKWMSNTAKGCSDPHIFIRDELARNKRPPVLSIWTEFQTRYLYRSIYSWVRLLFRAWSGILMWDLKEIGGTAWPIHRRAWKELNSKEEEVHWAGSDQRWPRIKCTPSGFTQITLGSFSTLPRHIYPSKL